MCFSRPRDSPATQCQWWATSDAKGRSARSVPWAPVKPQVRDQDSTTTAPATSHRGAPTGTRDTPAQPPMTRPLLHRRPSRPILGPPATPLPSISSTVSTVTPDKLRSSILILRQGAEEFKRAQYFLIQRIEDEEADQNITMQGLNGLNVEALWRQLQEALADGDELQDAVEEVADRLEDQDLDDEDLEDVPQPAHQQPGAGQNNTASRQQPTAGAPGGTPGGPTRSSRTDTTSVA